MEAKVYTCEDEFACDVNYLTIIDDMPPLEHRQSIGGEINPVKRRSEKLIKFAVPLLLPTGNYIVEFDCDNGRKRAEFPSTDDISNGGRTTFFLTLSAAR